MTNLRIQVAAAASIEGPGMMDAIENVIDPAFEQICNEQTEIVSDSPEYTYLSRGSAFWRHATLVERK